MKIILLILISILFLRTENTSQNIFNKHFDSEDGLPSNEVYDIVEDNEGFMWFATDLGVSKYNGYEFENYSFDTTLLDNAILKLYKAPDGKIWFISLNGYLAYYDYNNITPFERNNELAQYVKKHGRYTSFNITEDNEIYYGIFRTGLLKITPDKPIDQIKGNDPDGKTSRFINKYQGFLSYFNLIKKTGSGIEETLHFYLDNKKLITFPSMYKRYCFFKSIPVGEDKWICSYSTWLFFLEKDKITLLRKMPKEIICIQKGANNTLWVGLNRGGGLHKVNLENIDQSIVYLNGQSVSSILLYKEQGIWCSTTEKGVFYAKNYNNTIYFEEESRLNNIIDISLYHDSIYTLFTNGGIYSISEHQASLIHQIQHRNNMRWLEKVDDDIYAISGNVREAFKINNNSIEQLTLFRSTMRNNSLKMKKDSAYLWLYKKGAWLTNDNIIEYTSNFWKNLKGYRYDCSIQIGSKIYLGNSLGLWVMENNKLKHLNEKYHIDNVRILHMAPNNEGALILGTKSNGLIILNNNKTSYITVKDGLSSNNTLHIATEGDTIWCSTRKGLNKIIYNSTNENYSISQTLKEDIISETVFKTIPYQNHLWMLTTKGIVQLHRNTFKRSEKKLDFKIKSLLINDKLQTNQTEYSFPYYQNNLKLNYEGLDYNASNNLNYHYQMEGVSNKWNTTKNRNIEFPSLQPGNYLLNIYASNSYQESNKLSYQIHITPPWWKTWWFILIGVVVLILLLMFIFKIRNKILINRITEREKEKRDKIELQLKALRAQMNPHFMFNSLNSILYYMFENNIDLAAKYLSKFSKLIRLILQNSEDGDVSLKSEIETLSLYLELEQLRLDNKFNYSIDHEKQLNIESIQIPTLLIQPIVENAVWHGIMNKKSNGNIDIFFKKDNSNIICTVKDNGIGRKASAQHSNKEGFKKSLGLTISRERLNLLHNSVRKDIYIEIKDLGSTDTPKGTLVILTIPLKES